jgi:hypothetical protein
MVRERVVEGGLGEGSEIYILTHTIVVTTSSPTIYPDHAATLGGKGDTIVTTSQLDVHALPAALVSIDHSFKVVEGPNLVLLTNQDAPRINTTSSTQVQAPPPIIVFNILGNVTKGE